MRFRQHGWMGFQSHRLVGVLSMVVVIDGAGHFPVRCLALGARLAWAWDVMAAGITWQRLVFGAILLKVPAP